MERGEGGGAATRSILEGAWTPASARPGESGRGTLLVSPLACQLRFATTRGSVFTKAPSPGHSVRRGLLSTWPVPGRHVRRRQETWRNAQFRPNQPTNGASSLKRQPVTGRAQGFSRRKPAVAKGRPASRTTGPNQTAIILGTGRLTGAGRIALSSESDRSDCRARLTCQPEWATWVV